MCERREEHERRKQILEEVCEAESSRFSDENMPPRVLSHLFELADVSERLGDISGAVHALERAYHIEITQNGEIKEDEVFHGMETEMRLADLYEKNGEYEKALEMNCCLFRILAGKVRMIFPAKNAAEYKKRVERLTIFKTADAIFVYCCRIKDLSPVSEIAEEFPVILAMLRGFADCALENENKADAALVCDFLRNESRLSDAL